MCELLAMSANTPTDLCFSFTGLTRRGGQTGPHKDGWGVAFYEGKGVRAFHDADASASSRIAEVVQTHPIKSEVAICHIRQANVGDICLANTHPFMRELWGRYWVFAHNGQLSGFHSTPGLSAPPTAKPCSAIFLTTFERTATAIPEPMKSSTAWYGCPSPTPVRAFSTSY